jgi:hypothetical protein
MLQSLPECSGSGNISQSIKASKLFFVINKSKKIAYSNQYGSKGTTKFSFNGVTADNCFEVGNFVVYHGVKDASNICVPNKLIISKSNS